MQELKKKRRKSLFMTMIKSIRAEESDGYNGRTVESEYRDRSFGKHDKGDSDCDESAAVYVSSVVLISGNLAS